MRVWHRPGTRHPGGRAQGGRIALGGLAAALVAVVAGCADSPTAPSLHFPVASFAVATSSFTEPFSTWDAALWSEGDHALGGGYLDPGNVSVSGGELVIATPAGTHDGGEILSSSQYGYGTYAASMQCATPRGTVCAFFLYQGVRGRQNDEIDIEVLGGTSTVYLTTWVRGRRTNHVELTLPIDPAFGFHTYTIQYGAGAITFSVDGNVLQTFTRKLPTHPMLIMSNAWWPTWLSGTSTGGTLSIDWITAQL